MRILLKINSQFVKLVLLLLVVLFVFNCREEYEYYISNESAKDVKVIFIDKSTDDTLNKFILEPETMYLFYIDYNLFWHSGNDTLKYGKELIITQDTSILKKDYRRWDKWNYDNKSYTFSVREEDF